MNLTNNIMGWWTTDNEKATITAPGDPKGEPFIVRVEEHWESGSRIVMENVLIFAANADDAKARVEAGARLMLEEITAGRSQRVKHLLRINPDATAEFVARKASHMDRHAAGLIRLIKAMNGEIERVRCIAEPLDRAGAYAVGDHTAGMLGG